MLGLAHVFIRAPLSDPLNKAFVRVTFSPPFSFISFAKLPMLHPNVNLSLAFFLLLYIATIIVNFILCILTWFLYIWFHIYIINYYCYLIRNTAQIVSSTNFPLPPGHGIPRILNIKLNVLIINANLLNAINQTLKTLTLVKEFSNLIIWIHIIM